MKKYIFFFLAIVLTTTFIGQTHKHKSNHHNKVTTHTVAPIDTIKAQTTPIVASGPTLEEMQNKRYFGYLKIAAIILGAIILIAIISSRMSAKKRRLAAEEKIELERLAKIKLIEEEKQAKIKLIEAEKQAKVKLKEEIDLAFAKKEIWDNHYKELNSNYNTFTSSDLRSTFETAQDQKKRTDYLSSKYPEDEVIKIIKQEYWIGMTEEQLIESKGKPDKIDHEQLKTKTKKVYIYGNKSSGDVFNFVDGLLERFKDR